VLGMGLSDVCLFTDVEPVTGAPSREFGIPPAMQPLTDGREVDEAVRPQSIYTIVKRLRGEHFVDLFRRRLHHLAFIVSHLQVPSFLKMI
jgi:hypothetical protein